MREWMTEPTVRLLNTWTNLAHKETWRENPADCDRWTAWIRAAHNENTALPPRVLREWLIRGAGWSAFKATALARKYEAVRTQLESE